MKISSCPDFHRREFLRRAALGSAAVFTVPGAFAEALTITPPMTEGPFYPDKLPLDTDNDLVRINDTITAESLAPENWLVSVLTTVGM